MQVRVLSWATNRLDFCLGGSQSIGFRQDSSLNFRSDRRPGSKSKALREGGLSALSRSLLSLLLILFAFPCFARPIRQPIPYSYTITESPYLFSTYFEMQGKNRYEGRVIKNHFNLRTIYDLYDPEGHYEAQGICQLLSLGAVYPWAKDIDIYDDRGEKIGFIDGQLLTTTTAKYDLYNRFDQFVASAYLDRSCSGFTVMGEQEQTIAQLKRNFVQGDIDSWKVVIYDPKFLDQRILKIFSAFAIDFQEYFKEDI